VLLENVPREFLRRQDLKQNYVFFLYINCQLGNKNQSELCSYHFGAMNFKSAVWQLVSQFSTNVQGRAVKL
jgi:hypothetical protein